MKVLCYCKIGRLFSKDPYALENYEELEKISMKMLDNFDELYFDKPNIFLRNCYPTPSVCCRCLIFDETDKILMVKESDSELYSFPGGWCDLYDSPKEAILNEIDQEAGVEVSDLTLVGIINHPNKRKDYKNYDAPYDILPSYDLIFKAKYVKNLNHHTHETIGFKFFEKDKLPDLSEKLSKEDCLRAIEASLNNKIILD